MTFGPALNSRRAVSEGLSRSRRSELFPRPESLPPVGEAHRGPYGFGHLRHFSLSANRGRTAKLARRRAPLAAALQALAIPESVAALMLRLTGGDLMRCPVGQRGRRHRGGVFQPGDLPAPALGP